MASSDGQEQVEKKIVKPEATQEQGVTVTNEDMQAHQGNIKDGAAGIAGNVAAEQALNGTITQLGDGNSGVSKEDFNHALKKFPEPSAVDRMELPGGGGIYVPGKGNETLVLNNGAIIHTERGRDAEVAGTRPVSDVSKDGVRTLTYKDGSSVTIGKDGIESVTTVQERHKFMKDGSIVTYNERTRMHFEEGKDGMKHPVRDKFFDVKPTNNVPGGGSSGGNIFQEGRNPLQQQEGHGGSVPSWLQQQIERSNKN